jgi:hypothetical protein
MGLTAVFDERQPVSRRDRRDPVHVCGLAVEMHRDDCRCPRTDHRLGCARIDREPDRVDVGKDRPGVDHHDGQRCVGGRQRRRDDFVACSDPRRAQRDRERIGAVADTNCMARSRRRGERLLEAIELGPENEPAPVDDAGDSRCNRSAICSRCQLQERNHDPACASTPSSRYACKCSR